MVEGIISKNQSEYLSRENVRNIIEIAYKRLIENDRYLLEVDANERSITHRLAIYLEELFLGYDVDCEYNRDGIDSKKLKEFKEKVESDYNGETNVYPDIIVHHRGEKENLIVIEAKKTSSSDFLDKEKLRIYKKELHYQFAYFVRFPVGDEFKNDKNFSVQNLIEEIY